MGWNYLSIPKLQRLHRWSLGMDKYFHPMHHNGCNYLSMLGLKLNHVSKRGHRSPTTRLWAEQFVKADKKGNLNVHKAGKSLHVHILQNIHEKMADLQFGSIFET